MELVILCILCSPLGGGNEATSSDAAVRIIPGSNYTAALGAEVEFTCAVSSAERDNDQVVKWLFKGKMKNRCELNRLTRNCSIVIDPVELSSAGAYKCMAFDRSRVVDRSFELKVGANSTVDLMDLSTRNLLGDNSQPICIPSGTERTFECTVRQARPRVWGITWISEDGDEDNAHTTETPGTRGLVDVSSRFTLSNLPNGGYAFNITCRATSGEYEPPLSVTVQIQPCRDDDAVSSTVKILPDFDHLAVLDEDAKLACNVFGDANGNTIVVNWLFKGSTIFSCQFTTSKRSEATPRERWHYDKYCNVTIGPVRMSSKGLYECHLFDGEQEFNQSLELNVVANEADPPTMRILAEFSNTAKRGTDVTFPCEVSGEVYSDWVLVEWLFNNVPVQSCNFTNSKKSTESTPGRAWHFGEHCNLTIRPVEMWSDGLYECNLSHGDGTVSQSVELNVVGGAIDPPEIRILQGSDYAVVLGSNVTLTCEVSGQVSNSTILVKWSFQNMEKVSCQFTDAASREPLKEHGDTKKRCNLTINPVAISSEGSYECSLYDGDMMTFQSLELDVDDECDVDSQNMCDVSAECVSTVDGFSCMCNDGFSGDGTPGNCQRDASAVNSSTNNTALIAAVGAVSVLFLTVIVVGVICEARSKSSTPQSMQSSNSVGSPVTENSSDYEVRITEVNVPTLEEVQTLLQESQGETFTDEMRITPPDVASLHEVEIALQDLESPDTGGATPESVASTVYQNAGVSALASKWNIRWSDLFLDDRILGKGDFGTVRSGAVRLGGRMIRSAIKTLTGHASSRERDDFVDEFVTMTSVGYHPNVVSVLGACEHQEMLYVALEYLPHGDLRSYLRTARARSDSDEDALYSGQLVNFALDVAQGMEHLARKGVIHRDLAARNILLGEGLIAKVSDFGLARGEEIYVQTSKRRVPLRWLAIESMTEQMYSERSDVWSFGILLWEIATLGGTPYPNINNALLTARITEGYRMPKPSNCNDEIYALMLHCWEEDPNNRPSFTDLVSTLTEMAEDHIKHTYIVIDRFNCKNLSVIQPELDDN